MQKITVEISAKGYTGLNVENIEKALNHYFGSPTLGVSFSVTEAAQQSVQRTCDHARTLRMPSGKLFCVVCQEYIA